MSYCDVIVPGPWWHSLTYEIPFCPAPGSRVFVPVGNGFRIGILENVFEKYPGGAGYAIRKAGAILDETPLLTPSMLNLIQWTGKTFLCGAGKILKTALPSSFLTCGDTLSFPSFHQEEEKKVPDRNEYNESFIFACNTEIRWRRFVESIEKNASFLILFPEQTLAKAFWDYLPSRFKEKAILWPSRGGKKLMETWLAARQGWFSGIVGGPGAVFAPLPGIRTVIVEEESSGAFRAYKHPYINSRTIAGKRARLEEASLMLAGRLPSSRIFLRGKLECHDRPSRSAVRFVDIRKGFSSESIGVSGSLPLTDVLFSETKKCISQGKVALWLLDRKGYAGEVACEDCGSPVKCLKCGTVMAWEEKKGRLRCSLCGVVRPIPEVCPICRGVLLLGKRPGLEALFPVARSLISKEMPVFLWEEAKPVGKTATASLAAKLAGGGIVLGTRACLALCDMADVGFAGWIDADGEVRNVAFQAKFTAFSMIWESLWRGNNGRNRTILLQSRRPGTGWQKGVLLGWSRFWKEELQERKELGLPPYSYLLEVKAPSLKWKERIMTKLEENGYFPMEPGDPPLFFWVTSLSLGDIYNILAPFFSIGNSKMGFSEITVWID